jgi:hypothetical protein
MIEENEWNQTPNHKRCWESEFVQIANRALWLHLELPQIRFETNRKFERFLSLSIRILMSVKNQRRVFKNYKYQASQVHIKPCKTIPLSSFSNLVTQSLWTVLLTTDSLHKYRSWSGLCGGPGLLLLSTIDLPLICGKYIVCPDQLFVSWLSEKLV